VNGDGVEIVDTTSQRASSRPFRVLSLDGGGMRGVYTATYLGELAEAFARKRHVTALDIGKGFDVIAGTSTGGIVACALAAGIPLREVVSLYREHGHAIFPMKLPTRPGPALIVQLFSRPTALASGAKLLREVLEVRFGNETLEEVYHRRGVALAITAVEMNRHHSWVFKTPHHPNTNGRDNRYRLADVCLATTAAPLFRSLAALDDPYGGPSYFVFADGGLWANNPVIVGLVEALELAAPGQPIEVFALGTCGRPAGQHIDRAKVHRGLLDWKLGGEAAVVSLDAQEFAFDNIARMLSRHLDRPCTVVRFPRGEIPADLMQYLDLDETRPAAAEALINQARHDVHLTNSICGDPEHREGRLICGLFEDLPLAAMPAPSLSS
jgi:predicted acylesterase/phospholipase RssA